MSEVEALEALIFAKLQHLRSERLEIDARMWVQATRLPGHQSAWADNLHLLEKLQHEGISLQSIMQLLPKNVLSQKWGLNLHLLRTAEGCRARNASLDSKLISAFGKSSRWYLSTHFLQSLRASGIKPGWAWLGGAEHRTRQRSVRIFGVSTIVIS